jgi:predicted restriction endonuclease
LLLIAAHIDRWADSEHGRGKSENGLCLCALHDRAYELGLFVIDDRLNVRVDKFKLSEWVRQNLLPFHGAKIRTGMVKPSRAMLRNHRKRHDIVTSGR